MTLKKGFNTYLLYGVSVVILCNLAYNYFPVPPIFWRILLVAMAIIAIRRNYNLTKVENSVLFFLVINLLYYMLFLVGPHSGAHMTALGNTLTAFSTLFIFSYLTRCSLVTEKYLRYFTILLLIGCVVYYINYQRLLFIRFDYGDEIDITVNASTVFVMAMPLLFLEKNKIIAMVEMFVCLAYIFMAVKRGNIIACALPAFLLVKYNIENSKKKFWVVLVFVIALCFAIQYFQEYILDDFFMKRLEQTEEGDTSNRTRIYGQAFAAWEQSNFLGLILGNGYHGTNTLIGMKAHCDWLELLVDYGLFGFVVYLIVFVRFIKRALSVTNKRIKYAMISCCYIWGIKSLVSMAFIETWMMILMATMGILLYKDNEFEFDN